VILGNGRDVKSPKKGNSTSASTGKTLEVPSPVLSTFKSVGP